MLYITIVIISFIILMSSKLKPEIKIDLECKENKLQNLLSKKALLILPS